MCMYAKILGQNYFKEGGGSVKPVKILNLKIFFLKRGGKMVIYRNSRKKS